MPLTKSINRVAAASQWLSLGLIVVALFLLVRAFPVDRGVEALSGWVHELDFWGPVIVGGAYVAAALLFVPGSALTLASGAMFGLVWGTITVSIASTTAAALAFLIARYLARAKVEQQARRHPKFQAIDQAIGEGGWKIIALLRLSPVVPFSLSNYLYGLTAIRFWPCVLASWMAMLPGTFMYIYLGKIGRDSIAAAAGAARAKTPAQWAMLVTGMLATVGVTIYVTRLATRAVKERTRIDETTGDAAGSALARRVRGADPTEKTESRRCRSAQRTLRAFLAPVLAVLMFGAAACAHLNRDAIRGLFGPPVVRLHEAYTNRSPGPTFDHSVFDGLLKRHVSADGWVDYEGLRKDSDQLDRYIASVAEAPFDQMGRNQKLALLINAYNAFTLRLILDHYPIDSIMEIPSATRWKHRRWRLAGQTLSLDQIEHEQIRPKFREPRVHFALVCAAVGCPKLRNEAYQADRIEEQLEDQATYVHGHDRWFRFEADSNVVRLTKLYKWYRGDFEQVAGSVVAFAARYALPLKRALEAGRKPSLRWLDYDWKLNSKKNAR